MLFFWLFKNCEFIRDSSLWRSNFIPLVRVSIINVWLGFLSKIWILAFLGKYSNIFDRSQNVSIEGRKGIRNENIFPSFLAYLSPVWIEIKPEWCFLIFWIFLLFFLEFLIQGRVETEFETKFFFLNTNISGMVFLFFCYFFCEFSILGRVGAEFGTKIFFSFSANLSLVWIEIMSEWCFLVFWIFFCNFFGNFISRVG